MTESEQSIRESLLNTLAFLSSVERQLQFAREVSYPSYQDEFACWWFDTFLPEEQSALNMFTRDQLDVLKCFSETFERESATVGSGPLSINELLASQAWGRVIESATRTQRVLEALPNPTFQRTATRPLN